MHTLGRSHAPWYRHARTSKQSLSRTYPQPRSTGVLHQAARVAISSICQTQQHLPVIEPQTRPRRTRAAGLAHPRRSIAAAAAAAAPEPQAEPPSVASLEQLLQLVQQQVAEQPTLPYTYTRWVSARVAALLRKHERALVVARRDRRRALWVIPRPLDVPYLEPPSPPKQRARRSPQQHSLSNPAPVARQVLSLVLNHTAPLEQCTDPVTSALVLRALAAASYEPVPTPQIRALLAATEPQLATMQPDCLAKTLWALATLSVQPPQEWAQKAVQAAQQRSSEFGVFSAVLVLEGLAGLGVRIPRDVAPALMTRIQPHLSWLTPAQQVSVLDSVSRLDCTVPAAWLFDWCQHSSPKLSGFTAPIAARAATALFRLKYVPPEWWVVKFLKYTEQNIDTGPIEAAAVLDTGEALLRFNVELPNAWLHAALACVRGLPPPPARTRARIPYVRGAMWSADQRAEAKQRAVQRDSANATTTTTPTHQTMPVELSAARSAQAVYLVAKSRENPSALRHAKWARKQLARLLADTPAIVSGVWSDAGPAAGTAAAGQPPLQPAAAAATSPAAVDSGVGLASKGPGEQGLAPQNAATQPPAVVDTEAPHTAADAGTGTRQGGASSEPMQAALDTDTMQTGSGSGSVPTGLPQGRYSRVSVQRLVDVLYACAELRMVPSVHERTMLLDAIQAALRQTTSAQRTTVIVCLAVLDIQPNQQWCEAYFTCVLATLKAYSAQELANTLTATGYLRLDAGQGLVDPVLATAQSYSLVQLAMLVRKLQAARVTRQVPWLADIQDAASKLLSSKAR